LSKSEKRESYALFKSFIALILIVGCLWAAQWQYHRGTARHDRNALIESHSTMKPVALSTIGDNPAPFEWRPVTTQGEFDTSSQTLLRNRYFEGVYGFELLTRFTTVDGISFWVDCGWVKAGKDAHTQPELPILPDGQVEILGRLRLDSSLPQGSFFAIPVRNDDGVIAQIDSQVPLQDFYIDLISGSEKSLTPEVPAQLPELSDGPHMAYALQWVFFGGLVMYGRFLIRRDVLAREEL
jgi:cytochrome oxidase assembly protein ShyY1